MNRRQDYRAEYGDSGGLRGVPVRPDREAFTSGAVLEFERSLAAVLSVTPGTKGFRQKSSTLVGQFQL